MGVPFHSDVILQLMLILHKCLKHQGVGGKFGGCFPERVGIYCSLIINPASLVSQTVKNLPAMQETQVLFLGQEDPLEEGTATHSNILVQRIPWTEEPGGLQSTGSRRAGHG